MRVKPAFELLTRRARAHENALVNAYMTVTEFFSLGSCDVTKRDQVLSFLLDEICRTAVSSHVDEDALVTSALKQFCRGFPLPN
jgi:hypothetical protein